MAKIIVLDNLSQDGLNLLDAAGDVTYDVITGLKGEELKATLLNYDGAICRSGVKLTGDVLQGNTRLKAIARAGVGTDNIDKEMAARQGIVVMNTPGGNTLSTAEQTIALMMALSRNLYPAYKSLTEGRWDRKKFMGTQLAGKTIGVVGMGRIGQAVAIRAKALEMTVVAFDPFLSSSLARELGVKQVENVREMLPEVDYLTVHTPLNEQTRDLIGMEELELLKPGVRLINCARGGIYNVDALVEGLNSGKIGGVALDVYENEPCTDNPLFGMPNVLCSPHLGASTEEAQTSVAVEAAELLIDFFATGVIRQAVNVAPLDPATMKEMRGHLNLAYRLGRLLSQVDSAPPCEVKLQYKGEICKKDTSLLTSAFGAGLLEQATDEAASIINAGILLRDRGIKISEERSCELGDFSSMVTVEVVSEQRTSSASGVLFGNTMPRLVQKGGCRLESYLDGILLIFEHSDKPGVIGNVGSVFGKHNINIAQMSVGRNSDKPGGLAVGILALDSQPPAGALAEVLEMESVPRAVIVNLPEAGEMPSWLS